MVRDKLYARPRDVLRAVAQYYDVPLHKIRGRNSHREVLRARRTFTFLARTRLGLTNAEIGRLLRKHHTSIRVYIKRMPTGPEFLDELRAIELLVLTLPEDYVNR